MRLAEQPFGVAERAPIPVTTTQTKCAVLAEMLTRILSNAPRLLYPPVPDYLSGVFLNKLCPDLDRCGGV